MNIKIFQSGLKFSASFVAVMIILFFLYNYLFYQMVNWSGLLYFPAAWYFHKKQNGLEINKLNLFGITLLIGVLVSVTLHLIVESEILLFAPVYFVSSLIIMKIVTYFLEVEFSGKSFLLIALFSVGVTAIRILSELLITGPVMYIIFFMIFYVLTAIKFWLISSFETKNKSVSQ